jgi:predicted Rossmann fold nucleotide-binding protein DprA/Smf involved in DNA uptake
MTTTQHATQSRAELLKHLREKHSATVTRTQALLKEQKRVQQEICKIMRDTPKSVPEVAAAIGLPANEVLWYVASFKKYGLIVEKGMCGDYPLYQKAQENKA